LAKTRLKYENVIDRAQE